MLRLIDILSEQIVRKQLNLGETEGIGFDEQDFDHYRDVDFYDIFLSKFKLWVKENYGNKYDNYPISLLIEILGVTFFESLGIQIEEDDRDELTNYALKVYTKKLIKKGLATLPNLRKKYTFLERYGKFLYDMIPRFELPSNITLKFEEKKPYNLKIHIYDDFIKKISNEESKRFSEWSLREKLTKYIGNYLGIDIGQPSHGKLELNFERPVLVGLEEFKKNFVKKVLRPKLQSMDLSKMVKAIRINPNDGSQVSFKIIFDSSAWRSDDRKKVKNVIKEVLDENGYKNATVDIW